MEERWADIPDIEGPYEYQVSDRARFRRKTQRGFRSLKTEPSSNGYEMLIVFEHGRRRRIVAHRLVAICFIPNPYSKPFVNHLDGKKNNNNPKNLEWCTSKENVEHAIANGLMKKTQKGEGSKLNKLTQKNVYEIRDMIEQKIPQTKIAKKFEVSRSCISAISTGRTW